MVDDQSETAIKEDTCEARQGYFSSDRCHFLLKLSAIVVASFTASFMQTYLFSFLPFLVVWFGCREEDKGSYAGYVASSYFLGIAGSSYFWGILSDTIDRRKVMLILATFSGFGCLGFGFTTNIYTAVTVRFLTGLFGSLEPVTRSFVHDSIDRSNQGLAMSLFCLGWGCGVTLGPTIGGLLVPTESSLQGLCSSTLFCSFPFIAPSIFACAVSLMSAFFIYFGLLKQDINIRQYTSQEEVTEETEISNASNSDYGTMPINSDKLDVIKQSIGGTSGQSTSKDIVNDEYPPYNCKSGYCVQRSNLLPIHQDTHSMASVNEDKVKDMNATIPSWISSRLRHAFTNIKQTKFVQILASPKAAFMLVIYMLYSTASLAYEELLPVWASTQTYLGGLGWQANKVGLALGATYFPAVVIQLLAVKVTVQKIGFLKALIMFSMIEALTSQTITLSRYIHAEMDVLICVCFIRIISVVGISSGYAALSIAINNSVPANSVGVMNGIAYTASSCFTMLAPTLCGSLFSMSITSHIGPPVDASLVFCIIGALYCASSIVTVMAIHNWDRP